MRAWLAAFVFTVGLGCGAEPEPLMVGEVCDRIAYEFCVSLSTCNPGNPAAPCIVDFRKKCCANSGTCERRAKGTDESLDECGMAIARQACSATNAGLLPPVCLDL